MGREYGHIARAVLNTPWFIREAEGTLIAGIVRQRLAGIAFTDEEIEARLAAARDTQGPRNGQRQVGAVAVIPIYGVIMPRANLMTEMSGGTSVVGIRESLEAALKDDQITAIVGEFDSPGGVVDGIEELATWIRGQRGQKPLIAVSNTMCCSAALYLAAQFDEIVASPSSITGDIGVFAEHVEFSKALEEAGVTTTIIREPAAKHEVNRSEPLSDEALAYLQQEVGDYYAQFAASYAKGRGVTVEEVKKGHGQGRSYTAKRAVAAGLADRIDTLEGTVRRLSGGRVAAGRPLAIAEVAEDTTVAEAPVPGPFAERLAAAQAEVEALAEHARDRAAMRAEEGRALSETTRSGLRSLADSVRAIADAEPVAEPSPDPAPIPTAGRRRDLEVLEASMSRGYSLREQVGGTVQ